jgi:hypothetical protein
MELIFGSVLLRRTGATDRKEQEILFKRQGVSRVKFWYIVDY